MQRTFKYLLVLAIIFTILLFGFMAYRISGMKNIPDIVNLITAVVGLAVALWAFVIAMLTYSSIDSVNVITKMEGNVLENENYVTSFTSLIRDYDKEDAQQASQAIFSKLKKMFSRKSKTAVDFAQNLQYFIDAIVLFPYLFQSNREENFKKMDDLLRLIEKRRKGFLTVSTGNILLIDETVKLIHSIIDYQKYIHKDEQRITSVLLDVRGTLLRNSVTQTVYYNYLGLYYNHKAHSLLRKQFGDEPVDIYSIDGLVKVKEQLALLTDVDRDLYTNYLQEAKKAFKKALSHGNTDVMWEGFIRYNDARTTYFLQQVLTQSEDGGWQKLLNEALVVRNRLNIIIGDIVRDKENSYLKEAFNFEYYLASLVKMNFHIAEKQDITDMFGHVKYSVKDHYDGLQNDGVVKEPYTGLNDKIRDYQERLRMIGGGRGDDGRVRG